MQAWTSLSRAYLLQTALGDVSCNLKHQVQDLREPLCLDSCSTMGRTRTFNELALGGFGDRCLAIRLPPCVWSRRYYQVFQTWASPQDRAYLTGLEPAHSAEPAIYQLNYRYEWSRGDSNPLPLRCKRSALPIELRPHWGQRWLLAVFRACPARPFGEYLARVELALSTWQADVLASIR